jgi:hypothetical protein
VRAPADQGYTYVGGNVQDTLDYGTAKHSITIDVAHGAAHGAEIGTDYFESIEVFMTGSGDDTFIGAGDDETLHRVVVNEIDPQADKEGCCDTTGPVTPPHVNSEDDDHTPSTATHDQNFIGGAGVDTLDYSEADHAVTINVVDGTATGDDIGHDLFSGIEHFVGGEGDDTFTVGGGSITMSGGHGHDIFEFVVPTFVDSDTKSHHEIQDFEFGDCVRMSKYDLYEHAVNAVEDAFLSMMSAAQAGNSGQPGLDAGAPIHIRYEHSGEVHNTFIDADLDSDGTFETTIQIDGEHHLSIVTNHIA